MRPPYDLPTCCVVCGVFIRGDGNPKTIFDEKSEWKGYKTRINTEVLVKSKDIEAIHFYNTPSVWVGLCKVVIHDFHRNEFHMAGIVQVINSGLSLDGLFPVQMSIPRVPQDPQIARIGYVKGYMDDESYIRFQTPNFDDRYHEQGESVDGYPIHIHCWKLLDRIIGTQLVESNLESFVEALQEFWEQNTELYHNLGSNVFFHYTMKHLRATVNRWSKDSMSPVDCDSPDNEMLFEATLNAVCIPEIQELIRQATSPETRATAISSLRASSNIPIDIAMSIIDTIHYNNWRSPRRIADIRNALEAFNWRFPNRYWKHRCNHELIFEFADLANTDAIVDWEFLFFKSEELLSDHMFMITSGMTYRARILDFLRRIRDVFSENL